MGLGFAQLSRELVRVGRDIPPLGLGRIESGERRVDVDELTALAAAFGVSPATLLMPETEDQEATTQLTGTDKAQAQRIWSWLTGSYPLGGSVLAFFNVALPLWARDAVEEKIGAVRG
jgi:transcriptional regulator with XRE-family HTH domain